MLTNPTIETLKARKLHGMIRALEEQQQNAAVNALSFEERMALVVDRERLYRDNQRRKRLLHGARLKVAAACIEDINYKAARGLDKRQIAALASGEWIQRHQNLLITGATAQEKRGSVALSRSKRAAKELLLCTGAFLDSSKNSGSLPGGHLVIPHLWPVQSPPPGDGGTRDDYAV